jgi:pimeloyl-ACP methyl ester carboxylesterase
MKVYLLPGVACDRRLFTEFHLHGHDVEYLEWPLIGNKDSLADIAHRLKDHIDPQVDHALVGVSMGGMVAQELATLTKPKKVVLISSITGPREWPPFIKYSSILRLHNLITDFTMRSTWPIRRWWNKSDPKMAGVLFDMAVKQTAPQIRRSVGAILRWRGSPWKGPLIRIHGDSDPLLPLRFPVDHVVKGGSHVMVFTRPKEIAALVQRSLDR